MSEKMKTCDLAGVVSEFMVKRGWQVRACEGCGRTFFFKRLAKIETSSCGWHQCDKRVLAFLNFSKRKKMLPPAKINAMMREYFVSSGFKLSPPLKIANLEGQTDLVVAGVQMFDDVIHKGQQTRECKLFVSQPCVRMQFQPYVESQNGTSTSFVNVCTEKMGATLDEHLQIVDCWCTMLSRLGLHMNDFIVVMRTSANDWGTGQFSALELFFSYGGLELGDAAYMQIPQANRASIPISDVGFGLERIAWAINKTDSYFDLLIPGTSDGAREMFDLYRTLSLIVLCGVQATNKGPGLQFRRIAKMLSEKYFDKNLFRILLYYFDYWGQFLTPFVSRESAVQLARLEIERFINLRVCKKLNLPQPRDETTEDYFNRLVYAHKINICELRRAIQTCKK
ncbi:MAG TPA: hypothetical protein VMX18_01840 [Candidatus Bipolaricaulota bacterium]|nr:hypothetical protein [Candidatus Bipolaricaulota bacterium]